ncbi:hypothetical protein ES703_109193 [subsurface metagenome]
MALSSISITAPSSAVEGERVSVSARVTNISADSYPFRVKLYAVQDIYAVPPPGALLDSFEQTIGSGSYKTISGSFTMPSWDAIILVMVHRFLNYWDFDNYTTKVVSYVPEAEPPTPTDEELIYANWLRTGGTGSIEYWRSIGSPLYYTPPEPEPEPEPEEEFAGSISRKQLEYDESRAPIPVYNIPQGERGLVHIWGRNNMTTSEKLGIYWFIADPDGMIVEEYEDWEWGTTGPGSEHEFIGGRFDLDREKYTMWVELLMNPDNPEIVDRYIGDLCTVAAVPEYKGTISKKELDYDGARNIIPVY